jgi:hypothetical protein
MKRLEFVKCAAIRKCLKEKQMKSSKQFEARLDYEVRQLLEKAIERAFSQSTGKMVKSRRRTVWAQDL